MHIDGMIRRLAERTPDEILAFDERYRRYVAQAYRWDLWGAIYWLGGGCSDGGFWNARCLLVSLGQERLARILNNPDELADLASEPGVFNRQSDWQSEGFQYVATKAYQKKTGHLPPWGENSPPDKPAGEPFDFQDRELMQRRFPRIVAKYPEMGD